MHAVEARCYQGQLLVAHFGFELRQLGSKRGYEFLPFRVVRVWNLYGDQPRVLPDALVDLGDTFCNQHDNVVFLEQP